MMTKVARSNEFLTAVIHGAQEASSEVKQASVTALFNSLEFVKDNSEREARVFLTRPCC